MILSIGESKPKKWRLLAWLIQKIEGTDHSHSFVSWKDPRTQIRIVAEARGSGCRVVTNHHFKAENEVVRIWQYEIAEDQLELFEHYVWEQMGKPYGYKHLIGILLMRLNLVRKNPFADGEFSQICAELSVRGICSALGHPLPKHIESWGLYETQMFNYHHFNLSLCELASKEKIAKINGKG